MGIIETSYESIETSQLLPSFFKWLFEGSLNQGEGQIFGIVLIMVVGMVSFLSFKGFRYEKAMMVSSILTWITALLSLKAGWIGTPVFTLVNVYVVVAIYYLFKESSAEEP